MPANEPESGKGRFMISALDNDGAVADFVRDIGDDPDITLVDAIGPPGRPHTAVIDVTPDKARALAQRFGGSNQLLIEPDKPLSLFDALAEDRPERNE